MQCITTYFGAQDERLVPRRGWGKSCRIRNEPRSLWATLLVTPAAEKVPAARKIFGSLDQSCFLGLGRHRHGMTPAAISQCRMPNSKATILSPKSMSFGALSRSSLDRSQAEL